MSLAPGTRLGPYEVIAPLGAGGMGEVYRARDTRLDRTVAVKVLPEAFSGDPALRQRLHTEARAISQLSHPHICTLHDIGEQDGAAFLVMELIEGETLAERLTKQAGRGLPLEEALRIGVQIVDALAAAHRRGIVHRDLKPGNVMLARAGSAGSGARDVKLLDFGLAKVRPPAAVALSVSTMPTTPPLAATAEGSLLGTFQYMSPEQVEGAEADARSDIFAAGCVLYEMLTGARPFEGRSPAATMAAILEREPIPLVMRQPGIPPIVGRIVERCLAKGPDHRWQSAADLASALRLAVEGAPAPPAYSAGMQVAGASAPVEQLLRPGPSRARMAIGAGLIAAVALAGGAALAWRYATATNVPPAETRFEVAPPPGTTWSPSPIASTAQLALSPDGRRLAFVAAPRRGAPQIWIRSLDSVRAQPLAGTDDASFPFWSADSRFIGFFAGGKMKKVDIAGGTPQVLADAPLARGGTWNQDGVILFVPSPNRGIWRVPAAGGAGTQVTEVTQVTEPASTTTNHTFPQFLADGRRFVYYNRSNEAQHQGIYVRSLDSGEASQIVQNNGMAVATNGHLLLVREGMLFAQPVDPGMQPRGDLVRVAEGVGYSLGGIGYSPLSAAGDTLAYGPTVRLTTALQWRDRTGAAIGSEIARGVYRSPRLSADDRQVALTVQEERAMAQDIFTLEIDRGVFTRVSTDPAIDWFPVWAPGGDRLFFGSARTRATNLFERVLGTAFEAPLTELTVARYPLDATGDGRLVYQEGGTDGYDLGVVALQGERRPASWLATPFNEVQARVSPNGRWMAYSSDESGRFEVYVLGFPVAGRRWTISASGGMQPEWSRSGRELFYISSRRELMVVPVTTDGPMFTVGVPRALFEVDMPEPTAPYLGDFAVSADGQRFLINSIVEASAPPLTVVLNWAAGRRDD